jgi:hypothetical protein
LAFAVSADRADQRFGFRISPVPDYLDVHHAALSFSTLSMREAPRARIGQLGATLISHPADFARPASMPQAARVAQRSRQDRCHTCSTNRKP